MTDAERMAQAAVYTGLAHDDLHEAVCMALTGRDEDFIDPSRGRRETAVQFLRKALEYLEAWEPSRNLLDAIDANYIIETAHAKIKELEQDLADEQERTLGLRAYIDACQFPDGIAPPDIDAIMKRARILKLVLEKEEEEDDEDSV